MAFTFAAFAVAFFFGAAAVFLVFRARVVDATNESFVFEITGGTSKIDQFVSLMVPIGLVEVSRTGVAAISRGPEGM